MKNRLMISLFLFVSAVAEAGNIIACDGPEGSGLSGFVIDYSTGAGGFCQLSVFGRSGNGGYVFYADDQAQCLILPTMITFDSSSRGEKFKTVLTSTNANNTEFIGDFDMSFGGISVQSKLSCEM